MNPIDQAIITANVTESLEQSGQIGRKVTTETIVLPKTELEYDNGEWGASIAGTLTVGAVYKVLFNGTTYTEKCINSDYGSMMGNAGVLGFGEDSGQPFLVMEMDGEISIISKQAATATITVTTETIHPIDQKFLSPSRYLLNLSSVTLAETSNEVCIVEFVTLALTNGGTFSTTVSAENCEEFYTKAQKWAELSQEGYYVGELSDHAPQLIITDNLGMQLVPTAIYQLAEYLQQLFVSATLRLKQGDTFTIVTANCTVIFNANRSCDFFVTATAV